MPEFTQYADSYSGLANRPQTSGNTVMQLLSMMMRGKEQKQEHQDSVDAQNRDYYLRNQEFNARESSDKLKEQRQSVLDAHNSQLNDEYLKIAQQDAASRAAGGTSVGFRNRQLALSQAYQDADQGAFDDANHVQKVYPFVQPEEANIIASRSSQARDQISQEYSTAVGIAGTLNKAGQMKSFIDRTKQNLSTPGSNFHIYNPASWFSSSSPTVPPAETARLNALNQAYSTIAPVANRIMGDKRAMNYVQPDPNGGFAPAIPMPPWMRRQRALAGAGGSGGVGPQPAPAPPGGYDTTPLTNSQTQALMRVAPQGVQSAPAAPASPYDAPVNPPANQYQTGRRYGNLRYQGGDPNDENSWTPAQ